MSRKNSSCAPGGAAQADFSAGRPFRTSHQRLSHRSPFGLVELVGVDSLVTVQARENLVDERLLVDSDDGVQLDVRRQAEEPARFSSFSPLEVLTSSVDAQEEAEKQPSPGMRVEPVVRAATDDFVLFVVGQQTNHLLELLGCDFSDPARRCAER